MFSGSGLSSGPNFARFGCWTLAILFGLAGLGFWFVPESRNPVTIIGTLGCLVGCAIFIYAAITIKKI